MAKKEPSKSVLYIAFKGLYLKNDIDEVKKKVCGADSEPP